MNLFIILFRKKIWQINGEERRVLMSTPEDGDEYLYGFVSVPPKCPECM